ncbi:MAG TPA: hypothetical protein PLF96_09285 [Thermotogota bacterium]|nr:hypothetical protein [Thermotogota bacterium]
MNRFAKLVVLVLVIVSLLVISGCFLFQPTTCDVEIVVRDHNGMLVPYATVQVLDPARGERLLFEGSTDRWGEVSATLSKGRVTLQVQTPFLDHVGFLRVLESEQIEVTLDQFRDPRAGGLTWRCENGTVEPFLFLPKGSQVVEMKLAWEVVDQASGRGLENWMPIPAIPGGVAWLSLQEHSSPFLVGLGELWQEKEEGAGSLLALHVFSSEGTLLVSDGEVMQVHGGRNLLPSDALTRVGDVTGFGGTEFSPDGVVDVWDLIFLLNRYDSNDAQADFGRMGSSVVAPPVGPFYHNLDAFGPDGFVDVWDLIVILNAYGSTLETINTPFAPQLVSADAVSGGTYWLEWLMPFPNDVQTGFEVYATEDQTLLDPLQGVLVGSQDPECTSLEVQTTLPWICVVAHNEEEYYSDFAWHFLDPDDQEVTFGDLECSQPVLNVGESVEVRFWVPVFSDSVFSFDSVRLVREGSGESLQMFDDGDLGHGDEILLDGVFSTLFDIQEYVEGTISWKVVVQAQVDGTEKTWESDSLEIEVFEELTEEDVNEVLEVQEEALGSLEGANEEEIPEVMNQLAALLLAQGGISEATPTENSVEIAYDSGIEGGILVEFPDEESGASFRRKGGRFSSAGSFPVQTPGIQGAYSSIPLPDSLILNRDVLIYAPFEDLFQVDMRPSLEDIFTTPYKGFSVTSLVNEQCTVESLLELHKYGILVFDTLGYAGDDLFTREHFSLDSFMRNEGLLRQRKVRLWTVYYWGFQDGSWDWQWEHLFSVRSSFIRDLPSDLPNSVVFNGSCSSTRLPFLKNAFFSRGAKAYFGFDNGVSAGFCKDMADQTFDLLASGDSCSDSFSPSSDPWTGANFELFGNGELRLSNQLLNGDFEWGNLFAWSGLGDARVLSRLGFVLPTQEWFMGITSTGLGFTEAFGSLSQAFFVSPDNTELRLNWNFLSEEFLEFVGTVYQDYFQISLLFDASNPSSSGTERGLDEFLLFNKTIDDFEAQFVLQSVSPEISFDRGDVWMTGWKKLRVDLSDYQGQWVRLKIGAGDCTDSIYDSALLVDEIEMGVPQVNVSPGKPTLLLPENESGEIGLNPWFEWLPVEDANGDPVHYEVWVGRDAETMFLAGETMSKRWQGADLQEGRSYCWQVVAKDDLGGRMASDVFRFSTEGSDLLFHEDFNNGSFSNNSWVISDAASISIQDGTGFEESPAAELRGSSLEIVVDIPVTAYLSFFRKTSMEFPFPMWDLPIECPLEFFIDDHPCGSWTGNSDWQEVVRILPPGEHTLTWKSMGDEGYWYYYHPIAWIDEISIFREYDLGAELAIPDPDFRQMIMAAVGKVNPELQSPEEHDGKVRTGTPYPIYSNSIYQREVEDINYLDSWMLPTWVCEPDLEGVQNLTNLQYLIFWTKVFGLEAVAPLTGLKGVEIYQGEVNDFSVLENSTGLEWICVNNGSATGFDELCEMEQLKGLFLENNKISAFPEDFAIENLVNLQLLNLAGNELEELSGFYHLPGLECLDVSYNFLDLGDSFTMQAIQSYIDSGVEEVDYIPQRPRLVSPANGGCVDVGDVVLEWNDCFIPLDPGFNTYQVLFGEDPEALDVIEFDLVSSSLDLSGMLDASTTYYWKVMLNDCEESQIWSFSTNGEDDDVYEEDDTMQSAKPITLNETQQHILADEDWVYFHADVDMHVVFETLNLVDCDTYLELYDSYGTLFAEDDDSGNGNGSKISYILPTMGDYYLRVSDAAGPSEASSPQRRYSPHSSYQLRLQEDTHVPPGDVVFKIANSWGVGNWENDPDGFLYMTADAMIQNQIDSFFYAPRDDYQPHVVAVFQVDHDVRNECTIELGVGEPENPRMSKKVYGDRDYGGPYYYAGGPYPFPNNKIVVDITEFLPIQNETVFLKVFNASAQSGAIESFQVETYSQYPSSLDQNLSASGLPQAIASASVQTICIPNVSASADSRTSPGRRLQEILWQTSEPLSLEMVQPLIEQREQPSSRIFSEGVAYGTGLRNPTRQEWEQIVAERGVRRLDSQQFLALLGNVGARGGVDHSLSPYFPPIGNQDGKGSCVCFSMGYYTATFYLAREYAWDLSDASWEGGYDGAPSSAFQPYIMSPDFLYHQLLFFDPDPNLRGTNYWDNMKLLTNIGICSWEKMPYDTSSYESWPSEDAWRQSPRYRMEWYEGSSTPLYWIEIASEQDVQAVQSLLEQGLLVSISINANCYEDLSLEDFWDVSNYATTTSNHANTIVGYSVSTPEPGVTTEIIYNSDSTRTSSTF